MSYGVVDHIIMGKYDIAKEKSNERLRRREADAAVSQNFSSPPSYLLCLPQVSPQPSTPPYLDIKVVRDIEDIYFAHYRGQ